MAEYDWLVAQIHLESDVNFQVSQPTTTHTHTKYVQF